MTDKEYRELKRKIEKLITKWRDLLWLNKYRLHNTWVRGSKPESPNAGAQTDMRWEYLEADFTWYLPNLLNLNDEELEECVVHEFCHILISPLMYEDTEHGRMLYERVTTTVQRAISGVYNK